MKYQRLKATVDRIIWVLKAKELWVMFPGVGKTMSEERLSLWMNQVPHIKKLNDLETAAKAVELNQLDKAVR